MNQFKKCMLVMLPSGEAPKMGDLYLNGKYGNVVNYIKDQSELEMVIRYNFTPQYLYFIIDLPIYEGNYVMFPIALENKILDYNPPVKAKFHYPTDGFKGFRVIASTDKKLELPRPSNAFINKYVTTMHIKEVLVNFEDYWQTVSYSMTASWKPIVAKDGTVTVKPIKNNWTRDEVRTLFNSLYSSGMIDADVKKGTYEAFVKKLLE